MQYQFRKDPGFNKSFKKLTQQEQILAKKIFNTLFKNNPFDPQLKTHKINKLSAAYRQTVFSIVLDNNLRSTFLMKGNVVWSLDIGSHKIYEEIIEPDQTIIKD